MSFYILALLLSVIGKHVEELFYTAADLISNVSCVRWLPANDTVFANHSKDEMEMYTVEISRLPEGSKSLGETFAGRKKKPEMKIKVDQYTSPEASLQYVELDTLLREMMHVMGFEHEHLRQVAKDHVVVPKGIGHKKWLTFGLPFDYDSVMLYRGLALKNGSKRLYPQPKTLSKQDILIINRLYKCYPKDEKVCKSIDYTNLRHYIPDGEIGIFSKFDKKFTEAIRVSGYMEIRIGQRCAAPTLEVGCLMIDHRDVDTETTISTKFIKPGSTIALTFVERHIDNIYYIYDADVKCDLRFEGGKLTSVSFPIIDDD